jgi:hypothetical protein
LLDGMHSRARQRKLAIDLRDAAGKGSLEAMADLFFGSHVFESDVRDFQTSAAEYAARRKQIAMLQGNSGLFHKAGLTGLGVAQSIAYATCITTVYVTLKSFFSL